MLVLSVLHVALLGTPWLKLGEEVEEALLQGCQASKVSHLAHASCSHAASWKAANGGDASCSLALVG